jgi:hypothetical protein
MSDEHEHRESIQVATHLTLDRLERDLGHIDAVFDDLTLEFGELVDALSVLSECSERIHALMHRIDDGLLEWARDKHIVQPLVEAVTQPAD